MHDRLKKQVEQELTVLSAIGADSAGGLSRLLYSKSWQEAQNYVERRLKDIGMRVGYDEIGNLYGRVEGKETPEETILVGSHIDTVVNGGRLDGQYGILAAYLAVQLLLEKHGAPSRSIEVISMAEEEGSRFPYTFWGSKNLVGEADRADVADITDFEGIKFIDAMKQAGFNFRDENKEVRRDIKAFLEIHIEQGSVLETEEKQIGIVTSIVGQRRYTVKIKGTANHAGTTPMGYRKDAVYAFSKICSEAIEQAKQEGGPLVLTFGKVEPKPNTVNVVPGEVVFTIDCRHTDEQTLKEFTENLVADIKRTTEEMEMEAEVDLWMDEKPVPMNEEMVALLEKTAEENRYKYKVMHSGAGHDAQIIAPYYPTGLLFVPSINGISHNPAEETKLEDLAAGVRMFSDALYKLAYTDRLQ